MGFLSGLFNTLRNRFQYRVRLKAARSVSPLDNFEYNRHYWDLYARTWNKRTARVENPEIGEKERESYIRYLGDHWGRLEDLETIVEDYFVPFITSESVVAEIGVGGGRIAARLAGRVGELYCFDIAPAMLDRAREALSAHRNARFVLLEGPDFPDEYRGRFDFLYAFDVLVHFDLHMLWRYLQTFQSLLKPQGKAFIHTANLAAPGGWEYFSGQQAYQVESHYFVSPETVRILSRKAGFSIVKESEVDPGNFYLNRDYLAVLQKNS